MRGCSHVECVECRVSIDLPGLSWGCDQHRLPRPLAFGGLLTDYAFTLLPYSVVTLLGNFLALSYTMN